MAGNHGHNGIQMFPREAWEGLLDSADGRFPRAIFYQAQVQRGSELIAYLESRPGLDQQVGELRIAICPHHLSVILLDLDKLAMEKGGQFGTHAVGRRAWR